MTPHAQPLLIIPLSNNHRLLFYPVETAGHMYLEVQRPTAHKDGHGYGPIAGGVARGAELSQLLNLLSEVACKA